MGVRVAQVQHGKSYLGVIDSEVDRIAWSVDTCPALVLFKAYYKYKSFVSFIWELNDQKQDRHSRLILNTYHNTC